VPPLELNLERARRLAIAGQLLTAPRPRSILEVVRELGEVQMDPTRAVARTEHLVLFSRLGRRFRVAELERMLWDERSLFEFRAHIVPTSDYAVHREVMRRYPGGELTRHTYVRDWLHANRSFRRYVLRELRTRGPLRTRELEDRTLDGWRTGGWNDDGKFTGMMLEILWAKGEVMIVGRDGQQRIWDLAERRLPVDEPRLPAAQVARRLMERQLRARGVARRRDLGIGMSGDRVPGEQRVFDAMLREGVALPARVEGVKGDWFVHANLLDRPFRGRTVLLSPFDDLISDRARTEAMFDFLYRIEIYVPRAKRQYGYFVLPLLHRDRLIGRVDPVFDRSARELRVNGVWAERGAPADAGPAVAAAIVELGSWLGAREISFGRTMPAMWRKALRA
jgi:uncharacterized protein YcaQ